MAFALRGRAELAFARAMKSHNVTSDNEGTRECIPGGEA